jgi:hypothetical protein
VLTWWFPGTWKLFQGFLQGNIEKGCARLSHNFQLATEWAMQAAPWPASITEKQQKTSSQSWTQLNSSNSSGSKNPSHGEPTSILNRTVFCVIVLCSSKIARCFGGTCHLHIEGRWFYMAPACVLLLLRIVYDPEDKSAEVRLFWNHGPFPMYTA